MRQGLPAGDCGGRDGGIEYEWRHQMRQVMIYRGEDGFWVAECPSLPGCISQGKSKDEAIRNIKEAIAGYVEVLKEDGLPIPEDRQEALVVTV